MEKCGAFTAHYHRVGAEKVAAQRVSCLVHNVSPGRSAEPDRSQPPTRYIELGGRNREGVAQRPGETRSHLVEVQSPNGPWAVDLVVVVLVA